MDIVNAYQYLGILYTTVGLAILLRPEFYRKVVEDYLHNEAIMFFNGLLVLTVSYVLLSINSTWSTDTAVIITVLGWLGIIKGLYILLMPESYVRFAKTVRLQNLSAWAFVSVLLGIVMLLLGYMI